MKLPKCPHCDKLLVGMISNCISIGPEGGSHQQVVTYICPETQNHHEPQWVEFLEKQA